MKYQEILDMLDGMEKQVSDCDSLTKSFVIKDVIGSAKEKVRSAQKEEQAQLDEIANRLKQLKEEADQAEPLKTRTYTTLEDLAIGDTVKACLTTGTRIPTYLEQKER